MILFGIHCNVFIVLFIRLKTYSYNGFLSLTRQNVRAQKNRAARLRPIGIRSVICPGL